MWGSERSSNLLSVTKLVGGCAWGWLWVCLILKVQLCVLHCLPWGTQCRQALIWQMIATVTAMIDAAFTRGSKGVLEISRVPGVALCGGNPRIKSFIKATRRHSLRTPSPLWKGFEGSQSSTEGGAGPWELFGGMVIGPPLYPRWSRGQEP